MKVLVAIVAIIILLPNLCFAEDYYVYVRTQNRYGITDEDTAGRSKSGDIVAIRPVRPDTEPSEKAKQSWSIVKVSDLTEEDIAGMLSPKIENDKIVAYRDNKVDISALKLNVGLESKKITSTVLKRNVAKKTEIDMVSYKVGTRLYAMTRPVRYAWNRLIKPAYAETVSTINKTGEDYDTLTLWEDAVDGDLVTDTRQETAECYADDGALDEGNINMGGSTTDATYYLKITVESGSRHTGKLKDGGSYTGFTITRSNSEWFSVSTPFTIWEWTCIDTSSSDGNQFSFSGDSCIIRNNIVANTGGNSVKGFYSNAQASSPVLKVYNNIIYDFDKNYSWLAQIDVSNNTAYNATSYNYIRDGWATTLKNNIGYLAGTADFSGVSTETTALNNFSKDDTAVGTNSIHGDTDGKTPDFVSTTSGSEDLHLQSTSDAIGAGTDLSGIFTVDIDGDTRSAWDMGADEYISVAGGPLKGAVIICN